MNLEKLIIAAIALSVTACSPTYKSVTKIETRADSVAYLMGTIDGGRLNEVYNQLGVDTLIDIKTYFNTLYKASNQKLKYKLDSAGEVFVSDFIRVMSLQYQERANGATEKKPIQFSKSHLDSTSYLLGVADGESLGDAFRKSGLDSVGIKFNFYYEGFRDANMKPVPRISAVDYGNMVNEFMEEIREKELLDKYGDNKREGEEFLAKNKLAAGVVTTESGLQYKILNEGSGPKPGLYSKVKVHYTGWLLDGTIIDSSVERGEPAVFAVGGVIPGWIEALQLMPVGSKWKVFIPQELAYGMRGAGLVKPFSVLIFEIELLGIEE